MRGTDVCVHGQAVPKGDSASTFCHDKGGLADKDYQVFTSSFQADLFGSVVNLGAIPGALVGGRLADKAGRRMTLVLMMPLCILSLVLIGVWGQGSLAALYIGRFLSGSVVGVVSATVPVFIAETSPTALRGALGACNQLAITIGILLAYVLGSFVFRDPKEPDAICQWHNLALSICVPAALLLGFGLCMPETPHWYIQRNQLEQAERSLQRLNRVESGAQMLHLARTSPEPVREQALTLGETFARLRQTPRSFRMGLLMMGIQQFSGVNALIFYQITILTDAGIEWANTAGVITMVLQVIITAISVVLMDRAGRRVLLLVSLFGMFCSAFLLGVYFAIQDGGPVKASWLCVGCMFAYIAFFGIGLGPIPWLLMAEIYTADVRGLACGLATVANWTGAFLVTVSVSTLRDALTYQGLFWAYAVVIAAGFSYVYVAVPETKGRTLEEVTRLLAPKEGLLSTESGTSQLPVRNVPAA